MMPAVGASIVGDVFAPDLRVSREPRPADSSGQTLGLLLLIHPSSLRRRYRAQPARMRRRRAYAGQMDQPDEGYRTCAECGRDCDPDPSAGADGIGARIAWVCPVHGVHSVTDPFEDLR